MRRAFLVGLTAAAALGCSGLFGGDRMDPEVEAALDNLEATALQGPSEGSPAIFDLEGGGAPTMSSGNGVQVVHVAPMGDGRKALQAAVVFDRPMVGLSDLDAMSDVPIACSPEIPHRARWAGTTTAVWIPDAGSFPLAHSFTCSVPAGVAAIDSVTLENRIEWTFETARPKIVSSSPGNNSDGVDPDSPMRIRFSQPVGVAALASHLELRRVGGAEVSVQIEATDDPQSLEIRGTLDKDARYELSVTPGVVGENGPLPTTEGWSIQFETYPPLSVVKGTPSGTQDALDPWVEFSFEFSTPVTDEMVGKHIHFDPELPGFEPSEGTWASKYWGHWQSLSPRTTYTVSLDADLEDQFGQKLGTKHELHFTTGDYRPVVDVASGFQVWPAHNPTELPLKHLNAKDVFVRMAALPFEETLRNWDQDLRKTVESALDASSSAPIAVETSDEPNTWELDAVDMKPFMGTGILAIDTWSPQHTSRWSDEVVHQRMLLVVADYGVTVKVGPNGTTAWVTSMETGKPVPGVDVMFATGGRILGNAATDGDGVARVEGAPDQDWSRWSQPVLAIARKGDQRGVAFHNWADGIDPWRFGLYASWDADGEETNGWGFTDRGIYRPGDPVHAAAFFRVENGQGMKAPDGGEVSWQLKSPEGAELAAGTGALTRGNFALKTELPKDGMLGDYSLRIDAKFGERSRSVWLTVPSRAYREPAFRVSVHSDKEALQGASVSGHLDARYMFGAPLSGGDVTWRAWSEAASFDPEGFDGFWFGPERRWWWEESDPQDGLGTLSTKETTVAEGGTWTLNAPDGLDRPIDLNLEAEVTDVDRQQISGRTVVRVHPTSAYVGVRPLERMPMEGETSSFEVVAVTPEGERALKATTVIEVLQRTWKSAREKSVDGQWEYVSTVEEREVHREERQVGGNAETIEWKPEGAGTYVIRATRKEEGGRKQVAEERIYVRGSGYASWGIDEDQLLRLIPDKPTYHIGDNARILVQSPVPGLQALVTVEREGVLWSQVVELEGTATTVDIPISEAWIPNVFVSVVSVEGAPSQDSPDAGRPQVRVGMVDIAVDPEDARLSVDVSTDREVYRPREQVTVSLDVKQGDGSAAANADVVLYAVDEAVLSLTNYQTPDPISGLIHHRELSAFTGDSRTRVVDRARYLTKGAADAGGGGDETGPEIRENFITTITWQPSLRTDANGKIEATFELPDNLTAFRVMAVATTGDRFGKGDREITVTRPIIARPALPRKMRVDDVSFAGVVVHNNTDQAVRATVDGTVEGPVTILGSPVMVNVPPHGALEVPFRLVATAKGEASFTFEVKAGKEKDAIRWPMTVEEDVPLEVVATSGTTEDEMTEKIGVPRTERTDLGGLSVDVGTSALAGAGSGLDYLLEYPHGCVEQVTSRGLGALVAIRVRKHAGLELDEAGLRAVVQAALDKLPKYRATHERGLSYWPGGWYSSAMGTAYAVEFMGRAKEAGFQVDEGLLSENVSFLRDVLNKKALRGWHALDSLQARSYVSVALARAGQGDAGQNNNLYAQRNDLSIASTAYVLEAIARTTGADSRTAALKQTLESRTFIDAASASIKENDTNRWARLWGSDDLSTAAALEALMVADGTHVLAPKYALHLASSKTSGRWANTRATAGVLSALAAYAERYEKGGEDRKITVALAGSELLNQTLAIPEAAHAEVALTDLEEGDLVVHSEGGRVYYEYRLAYAPVEMKARDEGFTVIREIEIVDGGGPDGEVTAGAMLAITLRVVTPVVRHNVAVVDAIPAGWEPLDSSLATTSRAPDQQPDTSHDNEGGSDELPAYGGSWVFDHTEIDDIEVRLYADYMPPGIHTFRYAARATTPGTYGHPPARAEAMYQPEIFGRTSGGTMTVGRSAAVAANTP